MYGYLINQYFLILCNVLCFFTFAPYVNSTVDEACFLCLLEICCTSIVHQANAQVIVSLQDDFDSQGLK